MKMLLFLLIALAAGSGSCASFPCDKAVSQTEKLICRDPELSRLDEDMATSFKKQLAAIDGAYKKDALNEQKNWLRFVRSLCDDASCLRRAYETRNQLIAACSPNCVDPVEVYRLGDENYNLVTLRDPARRLKSFSAKVQARALGSVLGCETLIEVPVGTAHGNNSFGGVCKVKTANKTHYMAICDDDMVGHFGAIEAESGLPQKALVDFTIKECFGG
ncbi:hypothetical protein Q4S45_14235 [Massilia sp. R2A-15]|uniref:lysozyme inhibitor LprI family protein n=1 Tax=Massilia sp. R2A-15 TaxID=3064278 RepID=UPI002734E2F5|nr:hypothetical protein [Massilia sp. R2A-15]WLI87896.1 hypothetical protein Q4S45_14235 [Massilia sp. R2A-15]